MDSGEQKLEIVKKKKNNNDMCKKNIPNLQIRLRKFIADDIQDKEFSRIWAKVKTLCEHPNPSIAFSACKLFLEYTVGKPVTELYANIENNTPQEQAYFIKTVIEEKLGLLENTKEQIIDYRLSQPKDTIINEIIINEVSEEENKENNNE